MIPCYRISDGAIGIYDLIEGTFYEKQGSADVLKGADTNTQVTKDTQVIMPSNHALFAIWDVVPVTTVTYNSNGGTFEGGSTTNEMVYSKTALETKYSHTQNISDDGTKNSDYGNSWNNSNITGTDRGDISKAHVVSVQGATYLKVTIIYATEGENYDYVCMWKGSHPEFTAGNTNVFDFIAKLGGANDTKTYIIEDDTVAFAFASDGSETESDPYGYYAIVSSTQVNTITGTYETPINADTNYVFKEWNTKADGSGTSYSSEDVLKASIENRENLELYAQWEIQ